MLRTVALPMRRSTMAAVILDRLVQNAHRIALKGGSLRRRQPVEPTGNAAASTDEQLEA
jgi:hypothetical protein